MTSVRGGPLTPRRRNRLSEHDDAVLRAQIYHIAERDQPLSVRNLFYQCTNVRLAVPVEKTQLGYEMIQRRVLWMRREGRIPYAWITDLTRTGYHVRTYQSAEDFIARVKGLYRQDIWENSDDYVEIWAESRSIVGTLFGLAQELAVSLYATGGFPSATFANSGAEHINDIFDKGLSPCVRPYEIW